MRWIEAMRYLNMDLLREQDKARGQVGDCDDLNIVAFVRTDRADGHPIQLPQLQFGDESAPPGIQVPGCREPFTICAEGRCHHPLVE